MPVEQRLPFAAELVVRHALAVMEKIMVDAINGDTEFPEAHHAIETGVWIT
jgi:hypothetical protein